MLSTKTALAALCLLAASLAAQAQAPALAPAPAASFDPVVSSADYLAARVRWHRELEAFARADQDGLPPPGGVVFVGSSTVRM